MTNAFLENAIGTENMDKWVTLIGIAQRISCISDGVLTVDPKYRLFYFDTTCDMMHVLNLTGEIKETTLSAEIPAGYVKIPFKNKFYLNKIAPGAIDCDLTGTTDFIHTSISFDKIVGIYSQTEISMENIIK